MRPAMSPLKRHDNFYRIQVMSPRDESRSIPSITVPFRARSPVRSPDGANGTWYFPVNLDFHEASGQRGVRSVRGPPIGTLSNSFPDRPLSGRCARSGDKEAHFWFFIRGLEIQIYG